MPSLGAFPPHMHVHWDPPPPLTRGPFNHQQHSCQGRPLPQLCPVQLQSMSAVLRFLEGTVVSLSADFADFIVGSRPQMLKITASVFGIPCVHQPTHILLTVESDDASKCSEKPKHYLDECFLNINACFTRSFPTILSSHCFYMTVRLVFTFQCSLPNHTAIIASREFRQRGNLNLKAVYLWLFSIFSVLYMECWLYRIQKSLYFFRSPAIE